MTDTSDKEAIIATHEGFYRAFSQKDISSMGRLWWQGSSSVCVHPGGQILMGWESIRASWEGIFLNTEFLEIETEIIKIEVDQALAYGIVGETVLQSVRGRKLKAQSIATNIFQKMAQKWYLVSHHGSPIMR
jgi:ketosteroid isomerase-like protein